MATIMTKQGSLDNIVTYEHFCDTTADMDNINPNYITLGSTCIVLNGDDSDEMEVYIANSRKEWKPIATGMIGGGSNSGSGGTSGVCKVIFEMFHSDGFYTCNKTLDEIYEAYSNELQIIACVTSNAGKDDYIYQLHRICNYGYGDIRVEFIRNDIEIIDDNVYFNSERIKYEYLNPEDTSPVVIYSYGNSIKLDADEYSNVGSVTLNEHIESPSGQ